MPTAPKSPANSSKPALLARAVALLARREYSRAELRAKLANDRGGARAAPASFGARDARASSGADRTEIDAVLDELATRGYLSDARFAEQLARQKSGTLSKRAIEASLKARGVEVQAASDALAGVEIDDRDALLAVWRRRFGAPPANDKEKARQIRFLQRRGFSLSAIVKLLRHPPSDEPPPD